MRPGTAVLFLLFTLAIGSYHAAWAAEPAAQSDAESGEEASSELTVIVTKFEFEGNEAVDDADLAAIVADALGRPLTFSDLTALTQRVTDYYRQQGYILARSYLPAQDVLGGVVRIAVSEGRYDSIRMDNGSRLRDDVADSYLHGLRPGDVITQQEQERAMLLLNDLPGVAAESALSAGSAPGTSDLTVTLRDEPVWRGSITLNNHSDPSSGPLRTNINVLADNAEGRGDQWALGYSNSGAGSSSGELSYDTPFGGNGHRVSFTYSAVNYKLGGAFSGLEPYGGTQVYTLSDRYPFLRSEEANWEGEVSLERTVARDSSDSVELSTDKRLTTLALGTTGDRTRDASRDQLRIGLTLGSLQFLSEAARDADATSAKKAGFFGRLNASATAARALESGGSIRVSMDVQLASKNLDATQKMGLGGISAVRGYPTGDVSGDQGVLMRAELRKPFSLGRLPGAAQWIAFVDAGSVQLNRSPWPSAGSDNLRVLAGAGGGVTWSHGPFSLEIVGARPLPATTSSASVETLWWVSGGWRF